MIPHALIGLGLSTALALGGWYIEHQAHAKTKQALSDAKSQLDAVRQINQDNRDVVQRMRDRLTEWETYARDREADMRAALDEIAALNTQLHEARDAERRARAQIYRSNASAKQWADSVVPPAIAERMRQRRASVADHPNGNR